MGDGGVGFIGLKQHEKLPVFWWIFSWSLSLLFWRSLVLRGCSGGSYLLTRPCVTRAGFFALCQ